MSIIHENSCLNCTLLDHKNNVDNIYASVIEDGQVYSFTMLSKIFAIYNDKAKKTCKKRSHDDKLEYCTIFIQQVYKEFLQNLPSNIYKSSTVNNIHNSGNVRDFAKQLFESSNLEYENLIGGNNSDISIKVKIKNDYFLLPPNSRFYCGCVKEMCKMLDGNQFDIVVADPPWWNKYIRRLKQANDKLSYSMMYNEDIANIPIKNLFSTNCLVAVWCTNAPSNIAAVKDLIFPKWGVDYVTTWYWLKVTADLKPICQFSSGCKKQPYERLIIGRVGNVKYVPDNKILISVPSALHSHKPPLLDLLTPYVEEEKPQVLELFARYLLPGTTSIGYEPLKWQHVDLYQINQPLT